MCKPDGLPNVFIEDSFLPLEATSGVPPPDQLGCITDTDIIDTSVSPTDCKNIIARDFTIANATLEKVSEVYGEFLSKKFPEDDKWTTKGSKNVISLTEQGCEMTKIYQINSKCEGTLYLARSSKNTNNVEEICVEDLTDPQDLEKLLSLQKEEIVPIQKTYYAYV